MHLVKRFINLLWFFPTNLILRYSPVFFDPETRGILNFLIDELPDSESSELCLDVGAGSKPYAKIIQSKGYKYLSLDIIENQIDRHDFVCDANVIPLKNNHCDVVVCFQALEHLPNPEETLTELTRILKHGGLLIVKTNFYYPIHGYPHDYFRFTSEGLAAIMKRIGMSEVKVTTRGSLISPFILNSFYKLRAVEKICLSYTKSRKLLSSFGFTILFVSIFIPINFLFCTLFCWPALLDANFSTTSRYIGVQAVAKKPQKSSS
jgi:SAM-dependent methyltransferase